MPRFDDLPQTGKGTTWFEPHHLTEVYGPAIRAYLQALLRDADQVDEAGQRIALHIYAGDFSVWERLSAEERKPYGTFRTFVRRKVFSVAMKVRHGNVTPARRRTAPLPAEVADPQPVETEDDQRAIPVYKAGWLGALLRQAMNSLKDFQARHEGNDYYTLLHDVKLRHPQATTEELVQLLFETTGNQKKPGTVRVDLSRARQKLAEFLLEAVQRTLTEPTPEALCAELNELGVGFLRPR